MGPSKCFNSYNLGNCGSIRTLWDPFPVLHWLHFTHLWPYQMLHWLHFTHLWHKWAARWLQNRFNSHNLYICCAFYLHFGPARHPNAAFRVPPACICVLKPCHCVLLLCSLLPVFLKSFFFGSPSSYTDRSIVRLQHKHLFGTLQLCFGWRVGLAPYSTEVEHVHENRYRGVQDLSLIHI